MHKSLLCQANEIIPAAPTLRPTAPESLAQTLSAFIDFCGQTSPSLLSLGSVWLSEQLPLRPLATPTSSLRIRRARRKRLAASSRWVERIRRPVAFTFVQPVAEPVEDAALLAGGNQTYGSALHRGAVVDVVFKNEDLQQEEERMESKSLLPQTAD